MSTIEQRFSAVSASGTFKRLLASTGLSTKSVLDIGCCNGEHLAHFGTGSTGITINAEEVAVGKEKGLDIRLGNAEEVMPVTEKYDAIYANNLFEHLYSPHRFLHTTRELLAPGGILVLGVPVFPFAHLLMRHKRFRGALADAHINFFTRKTLTTTVERGGWNVVSVRSFRIGLPWLDRLVIDLFPHVYVIATPNPDFSYSKKRLKELAGYTNYRTR